MSSPLLQTPDELPDEEIGENLVARVRAGDKQAFELLFLTYYGRLLDVALSCLGSLDAAEEVVQQTFFRLWARRTEWTVRTSARAYLYVMVRNAAREVMRHERVKAKYAEGAIRADTRSGMGTWDNSADAALLEEEMQMVLTRAIASLAPRMRQAYLLRAEQGLSYAEIAGVMGITLKTVETLIARARAKLHDDLLRYA